MIGEIIYMFLEKRNQEEFHCKIQSMLSKNQISYAIYSSPQNIAYSTGYISGMYGMWKSGSDVALAKINGKTKLFVSEFMQKGAEQQTDKKFVDIVGYPSWIFIEDYYDPNETDKPVQPSTEDIFNSILDYIDINGEEKIGIEKGSIGLDQYIALVNRFGEERIIDITESMIGIRKYKLPWEIDVLRYSAKIAQKMMNITMEFTEPGMTEEDIFKIWYQSAYELTGGKELVGVQQAHTPGSNYWATQVPRSEKLKNGDIVRLDGGVNILGYLSDLGRVYAVGDEVSSDKEEIFKTLLSARDTGISYLKPGTSFSKVFNETMKICHDGALPHFVRGHVGHTIGLGPGEEFPMISPDNDDILEPNMVLCFETPYYSSKYGSYNLEDTILITEGGCELFTDTNRTLIVK